MSLYVKKKNSHCRTIANGAFATGSGGVVLCQSTKFRHRDIDLVCKSKRLGQMWNENPSNLRKIGFSLEESVCVSKAQMDDLHRIFFEMFICLPIRQVTAFSNTKEWHLGRLMSLSSKQVYSQFCVLKRHFKDLEYECLAVVFEYMYEGYSRDKQEAEKQRLDEAAAMQVSNTDESIQFDIDIDCLRVYLFVIVLSSTLMVQYSDI